jgi:Spy/CpxP family protein refolding chaperone
MTMKIHPTASATIVLVATFVGGLLAGVLVERTIFGTAAEAHAAVPVPPDRDRVPGDRARLALQLDLTAEQQDEVDRILEDQQRQIRAILSETRPRTRAVLRETRAQIEALLTPDQRARWEELYRERRHGAKTERID